jgi:Protein of unknown function (DUF3822)
MIDRGSWATPPYDRARERAWHLSLLLSGGVEAWAVHALDDGAVVALQWSALGGVLDADELPMHPASVSFVTLPEWSTLVPEGALEPGTQATHLRAVHGGVPTGAMRDELLAAIGASCIYVHDDESERTVLDRFPHARPVPMRSLMVRSAIARSTDAAVLLLHRGHDRLEVAIAEKNRVLLSNSYPVHSSQDVLYFALLAAEGAGLSPTTASIQAGGTHLTAHESELLNHYFARTAPPLAQWPDMKSDTNVITHRWLALLEQFACVS